MSVHAQFPAQILIVHSGKHFKLLIAQENFLLPRAIGQGICRSLPLYTVTETIGPISRLFNKMKISKYPITFHRASPLLFPISEIQESKPALLHIQKNPIVDGHVPGKHAADDSTANQESSLEEYLLLQKLHLLYPREIFKPYKMNTQIQTLLFDIIKYQEECETTFF